MRATTDSAVRISAVRRVVEDPEPREVVAEGDLAADAEIILESPESLLHCVVAHACLCRGVATISSGDLQLDRREHCRDLGHILQRRAVRRLPVGGWVFRLGEPHPCLSAGILERLAQRAKQEVWSVVQRENAVGEITIAGSPRSLSPLTLAPIRAARRHDDNGEPTVDLSRFAHPLGPVVASRVEKQQDTSVPAAGVPGDRRKLRGLLDDPRGDIDVRGKPVSDEDAQQGTGRTEDRDTVQTLVVCHSDSPSHERTSMSAFLPEGGSTVVTLDA